MRSGPGAPWYRHRALALLCAAALAGAGCSSDSADVDTVTPGSFANQMCDIARAADTRSADINVALDGAQQGTAEFRDALTRFLTAMGDLVDDYTELNESTLIEGPDGLVFQREVRTIMSDGRERIDEYLSALADNDAPTADLNEVLDDINLSVVDGSTQVGRQLATLLGTCDFGASSATS